MPIVYPTSTGWVSETVFITEGEPWDASDPFVQRHPEHFSQNPGQALRGSGRVEQATAAPGEQRTVSEREADDNAELGRLQIAAEKAGVKVDKRWGVDRLRQEIDAAHE